MTLEQQQQRPVSAPNGLWVRAELQSFKEQYEGGVEQNEAIMGYLHSDCPLLNRKRQITEHYTESSRCLWQNMTDGNSLQNVYYRSYAETN